MTARDFSLRLTWAEVAKWLTLIVGITTTFVIMQTKIATLEKGREENKHNIELLGERMRLMELQISSINEKSTQISNDVTVIKNAILSNSFGSHQ